MYINYPCMYCIFSKHSTLFGHNIVLFTYFDYMHAYYGSVSKTKQFSHDNVL